MKKKIMCLTAAALMLVSVLAIPVSAYKVGDKVSTYAYTDIVTYIDNKPIESFNINWETAVIVEDLADYGFNVAWDPTPGNRNLKVTRNYNKPVTSTFVPAASGHKNGDYAGDVLYTDIVTYFEGQKVDSFNINGRTIVYVNDIAKFYAQPGTYSYNDATRILSLSLQKSTVTPAPTPAQSTTPAPAQTPALRFTAQPSNVSTKANTAAQFTVAVTGGKAPYTYKWEMKTSSAATWSDAGNSAAILSIPANKVESYAGYMFRCTVTDAAGQSLVSNSATLTISAAPLKVTITADNSTVSSGSDVVVRASVTGGTAPYRYTWYRYNSYNSQWLNIGVSESNVFTVLNLTGSTYIRCEVYDSAGARNTSEYVTVNVAAELKATATADKQSVAYGGSVNASCTVTGGKAPFTYTWYRYFNGQWYNLGSSTLNTMPINNLVADTTVRCEVTDANNTKVYSNNLNIKVTVAMKATATADTSSVAYGQSAYVTVSVSGGTSPYTYTWYRKYMNQWVSLGSTTTSTYYANSLTENTTIRCEVTDMAGNRCTSNEVTISIIQTMYAEAHADVSSVNYGGSGSATANVSGGKAPYVYTWYQYYNQGWVQIGQFTSNSTSNTYTITVMTEPAILRCTVTDAAGNEAKTEAVSINVTDRANITATIECDSPIYNYGDDAWFDVAVDGGTYPYTYRWWVDYNDGYGFRNVYYSTYNQFALRQLSRSYDKITVYCEVVDAYGNSQNSNKITITILEMIG